MTTAQLAFEAGERLRRDGHLVDALVKYREAVAASSEYLPAWMRIAEMARRARRGARRRGLPRDRRDPRPRSRSALPGARSLRGRTVGAAAPGRTRRERAEATPPSPARPSSASSRGPARWARCRRSTSRGPSDCSPDSEGDADPVATVGRRPADRGPSGRSSPSIPAAGSVDASPPTRAITSCACGGSGSGTRSCSSTGGGGACSRGSSRRERRRRRSRSSGPYPDREPAAGSTSRRPSRVRSRLDDLVASLAELGVTTWTPLRCERSERGALEVLERRRDRLARSIREAAKVSGRSRFLVMAPPSALAEFVAAAESARSSSSIPTRGPDRSAPWWPRSRRTRPFTLVVGPEGGFTPAELGRRGGRGVPTASLGACALRTELAAVAAAAVALASG